MKINYRNVKGGIIILMQCKDMACEICSESKNCLQNLQGNGNTIRESLRINKIKKVNKININKALKSNK